jgi:hypothetical protein
MGFSSQDTFHITSMTDSCPSTGKKGISDKKLFGEKGMSYLINALLSD